MNWNSIKIAFFFIALLINYIGKAQVISTPIPDSLRQLSYGDLKSLFYNELENDGNPNFVGEVYKAIAKEKSDSTQIARAFGLLARINGSEKGLALTDSVIKYSLNSDDISYPAAGYSLKGYWSYQLGNYQNSLDNYLLAYDSARKKRNIGQEIDLAQAIAALKNRWGDYEGAARLYRKHLNYLNRSLAPTNVDKEDYLRTLYNLTLSYQHLNKADSASILIAEGITKSLGTKDSVFYLDFKHTEAVNYFLLDQYEQSEELFNQLEKEKLDSFKLGISSFYLGRIAEIDKRENVSFFRFKMVDSIYVAKGEIFPELRPTYEFLVDYYRSKDQPSKELEYIRKLISIDSTLSLNREYINETITKKYEVPELIKQKEQLIDILNNRNSNQKDWNVRLSAIIIFLLLSTLYFYIKSKKNIRRYEDFRESRKLKPSYTEPETKSTVTSEIESILTDKLERFERDLEFTDPNMTLFTLAKNMGTNSTYLSRVINGIKDKNFSTYINELRINLILKRLDEEHLLSRYTVQALGEEVGFKKGAAFSKAFLKYTQIKPSFYLKQLQGGADN